MQTLEVTEIVLAVAGENINADLVTPPNAYGLVVLPLGSSSGRIAARNDSVARTLHENGLATLAVHLLTPEEAAREGGEGEVRPEEATLCDRLQRACRRARTLDGSRPLPLALCGIGADAALALWLAALEPDAVRAVATLGGRPDLAPGDMLARVCAPTLFVVGSPDPFVLEATREATRALRAPHRVAVVPGAHHAFVAPQAMEHAALHAALWFRRHLGRLSHRPPIGEEACVE